MNNSSLHFLPKIIVLN